MHVNFTDGRCYPLGPSIQEGGVNFSIYSKSATAAQLLLFADDNDDQPRVITLSREHNKTGHYWHCFVEGIGAGQRYGWRMDGPHEPEQGLRFDVNKVLLDPYAPSVVMSDQYDRGLACQYGKDNVGHCLKGVVADFDDFDWQGTAPLRRSVAETVIYEMHVKGFTAHPNSGVSEDKRGTYAGIIEKIPYLKELGVTAIELLPVQLFDPQDVPGDDKANYWGYSPISFFAPHRAYASDQSPLGPLNEFRTMVRELHKADIEVFLDVVFNHTAEGNEQGPTLSYRGFQNDIYYMLEPEQAQYYANYSGCGNTFNANISISRRMIIDALQFWVRDMHVDGFRFDLASVLSRDANGVPLEEPPVLWAIDTDPVLSGAKIIAEAWDAGGLYQVGSFIGDRWQEWNGKFRDDVRAFIKGDEGLVSAFSNRLIGSPDLYYDHHTTPHRSINFITAHDGFTLYDLVSYDDKHNEDNGEHNQDGEDDNNSWNCGVEGPTDDPEVNALRQRQMRNFMTVLLSSLGTPMIAMGDEVARTQQGNNNAYCQDNELSWFDWQQVEDNADLLRFVGRMIRWRLKSMAHDETRHGTLAEVLDHTKVRWHGVAVDEPDWAPNSRTLALSIRGAQTRSLMYMAFNAYHEPLTFNLPEVPNRYWSRVVDTALPSPHDVVAPGNAEALSENSYELQPYSAVVMVAKECDD